MSIFSSLKIGQEKYPALTGIRALGATAVFFDHFPPFPDRQITLNVMAFFFALSGFLIVRIYYERAQLNRSWLTKYFVNRYARIYPVYFLLLTLALCLQRDFEPWDLLTNYTLTHALFHGTKLIIQPSWSLTVEECFYVLAPLLMILARIYNTLVPLALGGLSLLLALVVSKLGIAFLGTPAFVLTTTFFGHFLEFFAGAYLALAVMKLEKSGTIHTPGCQFTLAGLIGVLLLSFAMSRIYGHPPLDVRAVVLINNFLIPFPIALLYWGLVRERSILSQFLSGKFLGLLGRASYSFYLLHTLIVNYISVPLLDATGHRIAWVILTLLFTWCASILLFAFYEEPVNLFIRRKFLSNTKQIGLPATLFR
ncbi:MAG TPA: acyltransferase [Steroidobacteraceae bacterium]|nr:acyltransferase [Steroidobacteraceae bacterium]